MNIRLPLVTLVMPLCLMGASCHKQVPEGGKTWEYVLKSCGASDLQNSKPLYFGAANGNGVGTIWSYDLDTKDYYPTSQLSDITTRKDIVFSNVEIACSGSVQSGLAFDVGVTAKPVVYPVSGEIQGAFKNAESAKVSVQSIVQEDAYWDRFNSEFKKLPEDGSIMSGVEKNNRFIVGRAWKVKGLKAVLSYQGENAIAAKAAIDAKAATGTLGVSAKLTDNNTLEISSSQDLYIAGVLRKLSPGGLSAGSGETVSDWISVPENSNVIPPH
ncbi:hypothetical protein [Pseudomonas sp. AP3_22 TE3818]